MYIFLYVRIIFIGLCLLLPLQQWIATFHGYSFLWIIVCCTDLKWFPQQSCMTDDFVNVKWSENTFEWELLSVFVCGMQAFAKCYLPLFIIITHSIVWNEWIVFVCVLKLMYYSMLLSSLCVTKHALVVRAVHLQWSRKNYQPKTTVLKLAWYLGKNKQNKNG